AELCSGIVARRDDLRAGVNDALGAVQKFLDVNSHQRSRDHSEKGERGIASAYVWRVKKDSLEVVISRHLLHQCAGVCDCDKVFARILFDLADLIVPVFVKDQRLGRRARLGRDDEETMLKIDLMSEAVNRVGVCRIQDEKLRIVFLMPEGLAKDFRTKRRAAHAAEHHMFELARASYAICK